MVAVGAIAIVRGVRGAEHDLPATDRAFAIYVERPGQTPEIVRWRYSTRTACEVDLSSERTVRRWPSGTRTRCDVAGAL